MTGGPRPFLVPESECSWKSLSVPFRRLNQGDRYKKCDWIECRLQRNQSDPRPETFRPIDQNELRPVAHSTFPRKI